MKFSDAHTHARPLEAVIRHLFLDVKVDFDTKIISGVARYDIENISGTDSIVLDCRFLQIQKITSGEGEEKEIQFLVGPDDAILGSALSIPIEKNTKRINIYYSTTEKSGALQWLSAAQTAGKAQPFLFTQSQAILARTWVPVQDGPGIRFTYDATVKVPSNLMAVMSAGNPQTLAPDGVYHFKMEYPIPAYLLALAVGDITFRPIMERTGVYAEKAIIAKAEYEFGEMENMLIAAEKLYGGYRWGRYDVIVLPPSFPFGGMENPRLTFATPTILAGDRSLTSLIAHEMAHSWSGNLVTNANWNDFWLNEGFTVYFENRIMESIYGRDFSEMEAMLAKTELEGTIKDFMLTKPKDTELKLDLAGRDPEEGLTDVAYIKGFLLLRLMEESAGRAKFDVFIKKYFDSHAFQSMTTEAFVEYADSEFFGSDSILKSKVQMDKWIYGEGLPENCPVPTSDKLTKVDTEISKWKTGGTLSQATTKAWSTQEWLHFLRHLPDTLTKEQMTSLDGQFSFTRSGNSEIQCEWFLKSIKNQYSNAYPALEEFLFTVGRRKFLKPLYTELFKTEEGKLMGSRFYAKSRPNYHYVTVNTLDAMLNWKGLEVKNQ